MDVWLDVRKRERMNEGIHAYVNELMDGCMSGPKIGWAGE
jgi:hypothetical protein